MIISETRSYAYLITTLSNKSGVDIPNVYLLEAFNPSPGEDFPAIAVWEEGVFPDGSEIPDGGMLIAENAKGAIGLLSPDANAVLWLAEWAPIPPGELNNPLPLIPLQPGDFMFNAAADFGTLPAHSAVTTTTILILGESAEQVRELAADALAQWPILDDFFAVDHQKPGIFQASLDLPETCNLICPILSNALEPVLTVYDPDQLPLSTGENVQNGRLALTYPVESGGRYTLQVSSKTQWNGYGGEYVLQVDPLVQIEQPPQSLAVCAGEQAQFTTAYSGSGEPQIQWQVRSSSADWQDLPGETGPSLTFTAQPDQRGNQYRANLRLGDYRLNGHPAALAVYDYPVITQQPQDLHLLKNQPGRLQASAAGDPASSLQWQYSPDQGQTWIDLPGETGHELLVIGDTAQNGYLYRVAANSAGCISHSQPARLTVVNAVYLPFAVRP
ncbi:MAG: hypothetical protein GX491_13795 [Chloroflexi bacterium]|nr:hypothetical protein [Chloroflexota bacterium]